MGRRKTAKIHRGLVIILLLLLAACGGEDLIGPAKITLLSPAGENIRLEKPVNINFSVENFSFEVGYAQIRIDGEDRNQTDTTEYEISGLEIGKHTIEIKLTNDDGSIAAKASTTVNIISPSPTVRVLQPADELSDTSVTVVLQTENFGEGSSNPGTIELLIDNQTEPIKSDTAHLNLDWGKHTITARLLDEEGEEYISTTKTFNIKANALIGEDAPTFEIYYPKNGTNIKGAIMSVSLRWDNFNIGEPGAENKENEGYFRILIDNNQTYEVTKSSYTIKELTKGEHTLTVMLVQNDGTPYGIQNSIKFNARTVTGKDSEQGLAS